MRNFSEFLAESIGGLSFMPHKMATHLLRENHFVGPRSEVKHISDNPTPNDLKIQSWKDRPTEYVLVKKYPSSFIALNVAFETEIDDGYVEYNSNGDYLGSWSAPDGITEVYQFRSLFNRGGLWAIYKDDNRATKSDARYIRNIDKANQAKGGSTVNPEYYKMLYVEKVNRIQKLVSSKIEEIGLLNLDGISSPHISDRIGLMVKYLNNLQSIVNSYKIVPPSKYYHKALTLQDMQRLSALEKEIEKVK